MNRLRRVAGALCIAHVVLLLAGYAQQTLAGLRSEPIGHRQYLRWCRDRENVRRRLYRDRRVARPGRGVTLAARLVRGTGEVSGWFASLSVAVGALATAVTLSGAYAAAGAAFYGARHGYAADVVAGPPG